MTEYPILDETAAFSLENFRVFHDACPIEGWKDAVVFSRAEKRDVHHPGFRHSSVVKETDRDTIRRFKQILLEKLLPWLRSQPAFQYCYFRPHHVEWLRYQENMYFRPHKDFERYKCNGMVPYVALIGLVDTVSGGRTRVAGRDLVGGCSENGLAFFPSNVDHESCKVLKGCKICLKMECFVFLEESYVQVCDDQQQWRSFWSAEELALVDNYITSHANFLKTKDVVTSTEMARSIHNMMVHIADPRQSYGLDAETKNMLFPGASGAFLHDLFVAYRFLQDPKDQKVVLLRDARAWDYVNTQMELPQNARLCCGLWYKEEVGGRYKYYSSSDRAGNMVTYWSSAKSTEEYGEFDQIRVRLIKHFIESFDMDVSAPPTKRMVLKVAKTVMGGSDPSVVLGRVSPSDYTQTPLRKSGDITQTEREFCNDEDGGYETYTYRRYTTFYIQVRWCVLCPR